MRFIHQGRRDIPGYRVDLSRRRERERERGGEKKENGRKITKDPLPPLSGPAGAAGLRSRFSKVRHLVLPWFGSRETDILGCRFICSGICSPSASAVRGSWNEGSGKESWRISKGLLLSRSLQQPKNRGVLIERPFHGPVSGPSRPFDSTSLLLLFFERSFSRLSSSFYSLFFPFSSFFSSRRYPSRHRDTLDLATAVFFLPSRLGNPRVATGPLLSLCAYNTLAS